MKLLNLLMLSFAKLTELVIVFFYLFKASVSDEFIAIIEIKDNGDYIFVSYSF